MTREEIEKIDPIEPYCFETDREERWFEIGCIEGLKAADAEPNLESLWHDASEEPKEHSKIVIVDTEGEWWNIDYDSDDIDGCGLYGWEFCIAYYDLKIWAYTDDLLPKGDKK